MDISVISPVFNTEPRLLEAAIHSVLSQTGQHNIELILIDDASTNKKTSAALVASAAKDQRLRVIHQSTNGGPSIARSVGISAARQNWIGFIDSDDLWPEGKLDLATEVLNERSDTRWIAGSYARLLPGEQIASGLVLSRLHPTPELGGTSQRLTKPGLTQILIKDWLPLGASLVQRKLIETAGGFDPNLRYGEDWLLCLRMSTLSPMDYIERDTYILRRQGTSMMRSPGRMSALLTQSVKKARKDKMLHAIRRQLWWYDYATHKDVAMNNALNGNRLRGLGWALRALALDPREIGEFLMFLRLLSKDHVSMVEGLRKYSTAEQVILSQLTEQQNLPAEHRSC